MKPLLIAPIGLSVASLPLCRLDGALEIRRVAELPAADSFDPGRATVVMIQRAWLATECDRAIVRRIAKLAAIVGVDDSGDSDPEGFLPEVLAGFISHDATTGTAIATLRGAVRCATAMLGERSALASQSDRQRELRDLTNVGVALSTERDLLTLLNLILTQARRITTSDAGSLYLIDRDVPEGSEDGDTRVLRGKVAQNHTLPRLPFTDFTVPVDHASLAGYTACTGETLVISDVYLLSGDVPYRQNRSFDERFGYRTKSMLVIPMRTQRDEVIGVLQLINRKRDADARLETPAAVDREVLPFDETAAELVTALASQAAVAIENSRLYEDIERLFEGFVTAAVTAIESRDPTTSGHSSRVATMTIGLAELVDRTSHGSYSGVHFSREQLRELRYASLLHDFGKVGVREKVLVKEKKLYPEDLDLIRQRFALLLRTVDIDFERARADVLLAYGRDGYEHRLRELCDARDERRRALRASFDAVLRANEPTILPEGSFEELQVLHRTTYVDFDGTERPLLADHELAFLMIRKGTLDESERREIESHVTHTYRFLEQIPWTRELRGIPDIAYAHHEKLNGAGYPRAIVGSAIPVQTRMMTIADIFDALTAKDRPYKRAMPLDRALDVLHMEARDGMLDNDLLDMFIGARVFESVFRGAP